MNQNIKSKQPMVKLVSLGGAGEVTRNMFVYEYQNQVLIVDAGVGFPETQVFGIDYLLPDVSYLTDAKPAKKIVGIVLTHGHEDHISALPYYYQQLGSPKIYGSALTLGLLKTKFDEFKIKGDFHTLSLIDKVVLGPFTVNTIAVTHSIPDTMHLLIQTPIGNIYHGTDFKFDDYPVIGPVSDKNRIQKLTHQHPVLLMLSDSLRVDKPGSTPSEKAIQSRFLNEMKTTTGRFFLTTFSSNLARFQQAINASLETDRFIVPVGRSIQTAFDVAGRLKYLYLPAQKVIDPQAAMTLPPHKLTYLIGGSQGQIDSSLRRVAESRHPYVRAEKGDKIIFSSDAIPGNEINVYTVIDLLTKKGIDILYPDISDELYVSGHASRDELIELTSMVKPKFLMPIGGQYRHLFSYKKVMMQKFNYKDSDVIIPENGQFIHLYPNKYTFGPALKLKDVVVDGKGIGDVGTIVLEERRIMARAGVVFIVFPLANGVTQTPVILSRGFVFNPLSADLFDKARQKLRAFTGLTNLNQDFFKKVQRKMERFFYQQTKREPLIVVEAVDLSHPAKPSKKSYSPTRFRINK
ncbi:MAG: ribonuclease J [bacterium]|nr:ribonuclease J [bacterium]